jgi:glutaredoxin-like YruB-family protein
MITVYSTSWCGFCHAAKQYFDKLGVTYKDIDVEMDVNAAQEMVKKSGQMGVPVIDIDGTIIVGFDKPKIDQALKTTKD